MAKEDKITSGIEINMGDWFKNSPMATVAKLTWARPSPIIECFLSTIKMPKKADDIAINIPANNAFNIKLYCNASKNNVNIFSKVSLLSHVHLFIIFKYFTYNSFQEILRILQKILILSPYIIFC